MESNVERAQSAALRVNIEISRAEDALERLRESVQDWQVAMDAAIAADGEIDEEEAERLRDVVSATLPPSSLLQQWRAEWKRAGQDVPYEERHL